MTETEKRLRQQVEWAERRANAAENAADSMWKELTSYRVREPGDIYRAGAAAERERIRQAVATFLELALEGHMPFGDPYFEGAKDYCEMILAVIDAGEPTPTPERKP